MDGHSLNLTEEKLTQLKQLFPEIVSEGKVDFTRLKEVLGTDIVNPNEHYELSWAGKAEARKEIQKQTTNTLIPDPTPSPSPKGDGSIGNIFIEGENLEVLRILQKSYFNKIKMIYIDPPYNTGNDSFVYPDDYAERLDEYNKRTGVTDEEGYLNKQDLWRKNTRENGQFHSVWLSMMYPRLYLARNLLREDGVIFVSIDDNEASNLKPLLDEIFGEENFVTQVVWQKKTGAGAKTKGFIGLHEYILCYTKNVERAGEIGTILSDKMRKMYSGKDEYFETLGPYATWPLDTTSMDTRDNLRYPIIHDGIEIWPKKQWLWERNKAEKAQKENKLVFNKNEKEKTYSVRFKGYLYDEEGNEKRGKPTSLFVGPYTQEGTKDFQELFSREIFPFPKPVELIKKLLKIDFGESTDTKIVLDFFAGSGSLAQAVLELNEKDSENYQFICVQMPEQTEEDSEAYKAGYRTIADISKARITKVIEKLQTARSEQLALENKPQVLGFRSYKIAPSNFKNWRGDAEGEELIRQLELLKQSEKEGSLRENMLVELLLKSGLPLTAKVEVVQTSESPKSGEISEVYIVEDGRLLIFFGGYNKKIRDLIHEKKPQRVVCLDSAFQGKDEDISNFKLELKEAGIELTIL